PQAENALVKKQQLPPKSADASALATVLDRQTMKGPQGDRLAARDPAPSDVREKFATTEVSDLIDSVVDVKPRQTVAKPALDIESPAQVAAASAQVAQPPLPIAAVARPAGKPSPAATATESSFSRRIAEMAMPKTEARPADAATPPAETQVNALAADTTPPAHTPQVAAAPRPQAQV